MPCPHSAVFDGVPFTSSGFRDSRANWPPIYEDWQPFCLFGEIRRSYLLSLPPSITVNTTFVSFFLFVPSRSGRGSAEAPDAATAVAQHASLPTSTYFTARRFHREY